MTGMIEGFFGFEIFDSGIFLGRRINLSRDCLGYPKQYQDSL